MIPIAGASANSPLHRKDAERYARRQSALITPANGTAILRYLQVTRRWRWMGAAGGLALLPLAGAPGSSSLGPYLPLTGWLLGALAGELALGRHRSGRRRPLGLRILPPVLTVTWTSCALFACGTAVSALVAAPGSWPAAVAALVVVAAVQATVRGLHRWPVPQGPADLVGAELGTRSRSARSMVAAGSAVAVWTSAYASPDRTPPELWLLAGGLLPVLGWIMSAVPHQVRTSARRSAWRPVATGLALGGAALATTLAFGPLDALPRVAGPRPAAHLAQAVPFARVLNGRWTLITGGQAFRMNRAANAVPGAHHRAPFAFSGDGRTVVYLDDATHSLVVHGLATPEPPRALTGPLTGLAPPEVMLSRDGRQAVVGTKPTGAKLIGTKLIDTAPTGMELIDTATGARVPLPGARRVLGVGPGGVVAATAPRALPGSRPARAELLTFDLRGSVRARAPFDPALEALLTPDGRDLVALSEDEVLTLDPRDGKVRRRAGLRLPEHDGAAEALGWHADGRLLVRISGSDDSYHLVDPRTGRARPLGDVLPGEPLGLAFGVSR
ncbi:hypothetical protein MF672_047455 [Actinomadura sp. ATCC 31491]|uniref:MFS transporter n=1 Tax=Actinomadura luzonensis TaxID=2805427 RepID=A0ABT0G9V6_9ACTN|nr:hypothetical protein [Actinomadura luzonensis]MCK2221392.1 hypothetical protein [Actinomadura luzonensis]